MNLGEMRDRLYRMIGEKTDDPQHISNTLANEHLNDAYLDMCMLTGALELRHGIASDAGTGEYTLPDTVSRPFRVSYDDYALTQTSQRELDDLDNWHRTRTGSPEAYMRDRMNERRIRLYPIPSAEGTGADVSPEEGEAVRVVADDTYTFSSEYGAVVRMTGDETYVFSSEYGVVIDFDIPDMEVWAKKMPLRLVTDEDEPELPPYSHLGLVYAGAARVLQARTEIRNTELASFYDSQAQDYVRHLARIVNNRMPERVDRIESAERVRTFRLTRDTEIPEP